MILFNVKYSPNLGDGVIAECLEAELSRSDPNLVVRSVDIAGRTGFTLANGAGRSRVLRLLEAMPAWVRRLAVPLLLSALVRFKLAPVWARELRDCEFAIIGGGALLCDADCNFPTKLAGAINACADRGIPVAISHVGVTPGWSSAATRMFLGALGRVHLVYSSVRDRKSAETWGVEFGNGVTIPSVAPDPGLLAADVYPTRNQMREPRSGRRCVGVCVTSPLVLRMHGDAHSANGALREWYAAVIEKLDQECETTVFTNGSPEDELFADEILESCKGLRNCRRARRFAEPSELVSQIASLDLVIANRLHACIVAHSYAIPAIGLTWDRKLDSFFAMIGRSQYLVDWKKVGPDQLCSHAMLAIDDRPDKQQLAMLKAACREGIRQLACHLRLGRQVA